MIPIYEETSDHIQIIEQPSTHIPPHLHKSIEMIYVTAGSFIVGTGIDLFEMKKGDLAIIFPNLIHHYQVFQDGDNRHIALLASPSYFGTYEEILQTYRPQAPVIPGTKLHPDVTYALQRLMELDSPKRHMHVQLPDFSNRQNAEETFAVYARETKRSSSHKSSKGTSSGVNRLDATSLSALNHAYVQIIFARTIPLLALNPRKDLKDQDIVYQVVAYVSAHYHENISLTKMAADLGISPFALSRVFSSVFHQNFNHYVNDVRLEHVAVLLTESTDPITDICLDCGFQSQATFNRVFQAKYHMTPRQYRNEKTAAPEAAKD